MAKHTLKILRCCSVKKGILKNFAKFTGKDLCQSLFSNKVASLRPATLLKKRIWHSLFLRILRNFTPPVAAPAIRKLVKLKSSIALKFFKSAVSCPN